jgi:hypothetical protein
MEVEDVMVHAVHACTPESTRSQHSRTAERLRTQVAVTLAAIYRHAPPAGAQDVAPQDSWEPFDVHNSPSFRDAASKDKQRRMPPATFGPLSQMRT